MTAPDVSDLTPPEDPPPDRRDREPAADRLVRLALERYRIGVTPDGEPFAAHRQHRPHLALPLRGGRLGLRVALARDYREATGRVAGQQPLADALLTLTGIAQDATPEPLHLRTAEHDGAVYIDTGTAAGSVIRVTPDGWTLLDGAPVMFTRTELSGELVTPAPGGDPARLFEFLNVPTEDRPLLLAWLVAALLPDMPHPLLTLTGEQGTGKSTAARMLVDLVDPSPVPLRKPPRDADGLVTAFAGSWLAALDNLSTVSDWLSDSLCRVVTGEGDVRRQLYTDGGLSVFAFRRVVILTGIDFTGLRGDLAERMLLTPLARIAPARRRDEQELLSRWAEERPVILGALLDLVAEVLRVRSAVRLEQAPRMADFARILAAVDQVLGTSGLARYAAQAAEIAGDTLTASPFIERLMQHSLDFAGTAAELLARVAPTEPDWKPPRDWPDARHVTTILRRNAPAMRAQGWNVEDLGKDRNGTLRWAIASPDRYDPTPDLFTDEEPF